MTALREAVIGVLGHKTDCGLLMFGKDGGGCGEENPMIWNLIAYIDGITLILIGLAMLVARP